VNLTDQAWQWLATVAEQVGISRNDYLETLAEGNSPLMETVKSQAQPLMETVDTEREVDDINIEKQPDTELYPFIETVLTEVESLKLELEAVRAQNQLLQIELGNFEVKVETLNQELASSVSNLKQNAPTGKKIKNQRLPRKIYPLPLTCLIS
jgi:predicted RNase H-like nuclease (RuvC/YqgF family)